MPDSLERLDLLMLTVAKTRRVQQDGIRFQGHRYIDPTLAGYVKVHSEDFTDREAVAAILRITRGNIRLIERLMMQVEHILVANQLQVVTAEVVETARENLVIGIN